MKKVLVILNTFYPYARQEDFLANEMKYINGFDEILVAPNSVSKPCCNPIYELRPEVRTIVNDKHHRANIIKLLLRIVTCRYFYQELLHLYRAKNISFNTIRHLVSFLLYSLNSYNTLSNYITKNYTNNEIYLYSYWMHSSAFVACLLKKKFPMVKKTITRCHGFDIYEYRSPNNYIPMREFIYSNIDEIHTISLDGIEYLSKKCPSIKEKLVLSRLGTRKTHFECHDKNKPLRIVSCSWVRPVKRIDLIIKALEQCNTSIEWTHLGSGEGYEELVKKANAINKTNIKINLPGAIPNSEVIKEYQNNKYDVFVNVSSSEGVPVSIMEAMSLGMIIVATAVGGTPEVVGSSNGFLLDKDFAIKELADIIDSISNMDEDKYTQMCLSSRRLWEESYIAEKNYKEFYSKLIK